MNNNLNPKWISVEGGLGMTLCLLNFTYLISVARLLLGVSEHIVEVALGLSALVISGLFWLLTVRKYHVMVSKFSYAVAGFFAFSLFRFLAVGVSLNEMWVLIVDGWVSFCVASLISTFPRQYLVLLGIGVTVNALIALFPNQGFQDALDAVTVAGNFRDDEGVGLFGTRSTGLLGIAGLASYYAVIGLAACAVMAITERRWFWYLGAVGSILLGLGTGNRSFLVGALGTVVLLPLIQIVRKGLILRTLAVLLLFVGLAIGLEVGSGMYERLASRFESRTFDRDLETRYMGDAGIIPGLNAALRAPLLGAVGVDSDSGSFYVLDGERILFPHNAWVYLAASRGIPAALVVFCVVMAGVWGIFKGAISKKTHANLALAYGFVFIAGQLVCLSDDFLETAPTAAVVGFGLHLLKQRSHLARGRSLRASRDGVLVSPGLAC
jgi:hypothetical protein